MTPMCPAIVQAKSAFLNQRSESDTVNVLVFLVGMVIVGWSSINAIRTFMLPGAANPEIGRAVFRVVQLLVIGLGKLMPSERRREALYSVYGPVSLLAVYITLILMNGVGFAFAFWALGQRTVEEALVASGSSLSTLGFASFTQLPDTALSVVEAMSTTTISALLIGYLPSIFSSYLSSEQMVRNLEAKIDNPDCGPNILAAFGAQGSQSAIDQLWDGWTEFFTRITAAHGTMVGSLFVRSPQAGRTWVQASGSVLDAAALWESAIDKPSSQSAQQCLKAGAATLPQFVARIGFEHPELSDDPELDSGVTRADFDAACANLASAGFTVKADRDAAWRDFVAVRTTYAASVTALAKLKYSPCMTIACQPPSRRDHLHLPVRRGKKLPHAGG